MNKKRFNRFMNKLCRVTINIILLIFCKEVEAQQYDTVKIETVKLTEKVYMLHGAGGNIGVITGNDGTVIIDDEFSPLSGKIKTALKMISNEPVIFVINTHFHSDHTDGNRNFAADGAIIIAQQNSRLRMTSDHLITSFNTTQKASVFEALPKITFGDSIFLYLNDEAIQIVHIKNAHTDGDAIIYFKRSNVLHAGDVFVRYGLPFIDQPAGGSIDGMINGVKILLALANDSTQIIPGHGDLATKKDVLEYLAMLVSIRSGIAEMIKAGKTLKEIITARPVDKYKTVFFREEFIRSVYDSMQK